MKYLNVLFVALWSFAIVYSLGELYIARAADSMGSVQIPLCEYEDGNPDGAPCFWFNDGKSWYVDSSTYRDGIEADTGAYVGGYN